MPPRVSPTQLIAVPIPNAKLSLEARAILSVKCKELCGVLGAAGVRVDSDLRENYTPGWKYNFWELKVSAASVHLEIPVFVTQISFAVMGGPTTRIAATLVHSGGLHLMFSPRCVELELDTDAVTVPP